MNITRVRALRGPNLWSRRTAVEAIVSCTDEPTPDFEVRLHERLPEIKRVESCAHALALIALELQARAGCPVDFCKAVASPEPGIYQVVVEYSEEDVGRRALQTAVDICNAVMEGKPFDLESAVSELRELDEDLRLGPSTGSIAFAALERGIPMKRLTEGSLVQFGWGSRQRRIQAAETDACGAIAESIAQDKELTKILLDAAGVPVPQGRTVDDREDAWLAACEIGVPVVVKPRDGNQGKGIAVNISGRDEIMAAYDAAEKVRDEVIVERYIPGCDYRILVVGASMVAAARRDPPFVVGDGERSVAQLVAVVNSDPLRGEGHATSLTKIRLDDIALSTLEKQGLDADSVPEKGKKVVLRNNANLSTGGTATDVTDEVHPEVAARAVEAARMVGLDVCGVDIVCESVARPLEEQGGAIVEVNAAPGLRMHLSPSYGKGRPVGQAIVAELFSEEETGRIPVVAVSGTNGKTTTVRLTARLLEESGLRVGMTNSDGVYISGKRIDTGDCSGPKSARNVLSHPDVDAAVLETARGGILREGLAFDRCDVAIVTNIGIGDHLGLSYINTVEDLAVVKRVIVKNVAPWGAAVLNADDSIVAAMADVCPGSVIFFSSSENNPLILSHRANGERVVFSTADGIHASGQGVDEFIPWDRIPLTRCGTLPFQMENAMASVAAAWALGIEWNTVRRALSGFENDPSNTPGRFNMFDYRGATVIADYGHNPDAIHALVKAVDAIPARRRTVVISAAGDRRDEDIRLQTEMLGAAFDEAILYEDQCQRGRADGEVLALLKAGLSGASRLKRVSEIRGEFSAIDLALSRLNPGELCLVLIDQVEEALEHIGFRAEEAGFMAA
jgi:cyanophycin synthetase